ncbi:lipopolysaccharide biosynthesis protein [Arthrobacter crystallopoietes]|uniref:lipopolysaccharide biosynthesis protein n=1 Tax=Crystallibacter crystallopoietes TaxID=37928 RepID=UPI003D24E3B2
MAGARGGLVTAGSQGIKMLLQLFSLALLSRLLVPSDFGLVAVVTVIIGLGELFRDFGLTTASIQAKHLSQGDKSALFWINTLIGVALAAIALSTAPLLGHLFDDPRLADIMVVLSVTFILNGLQSQFRVELVRNLQFGAIAVTELVPMVIGVGTAISMALVGAGYWALVGQQLAATLMMLVMRIGLSHWKPTKPSRIGAVTRFFRYGWNLAIAQFLSYGASNADTIVIGTRFTTTDVGLYNRAYQVLMVPINQLLSPLTNVALPILSRLASDELRFRKYLTAVFATLNYVAMAVFAVLILSANEIIRLFLGEGWDVTAEITKILAVAGLFQTMAYVAYWHFLARDLTGSLFRYNLATKPITVFSIIVGSNYGLQGAAYGYAVGLIAAWPIVILWLRSDPFFASKQISLCSSRIVVMFLVIVGFGTFAIHLLNVAGSLRIAASLGVIAIGTLVFAAIPWWRKDLRAVMLVLQQLRGNR